MGFMLTLAIFLLGWPTAAQSDGILSDGILQVGYTNQGFAIFPTSTGTVVADPYATAGNLKQTGTGFLAGLRRPASGGWMPSLGSLPSLESLTAVQPNRTPRLWLSTEYLLWWTEGMNTPALVTTSPDGTAQNQAAILGLPGTQVLFGGGEINDDTAHGVRLRGGFFLTPQAAFGIESEFFALGEQDDGFSSSTGREIVGRPFFDTTGDRETAQLIDYPNLVDGSLAIRSSSELRSFLINGRASLCPTCGGHCTTCQSSDRVDWIVGYRHLRLEDSLSFSETLESLVVGAEGTVRLSESFSTTNRFNGLQLGVAYQANLRRIWLESMLRVAVGNYQQSARISGTTSITEFGVTETYEGGLLAQTTNSGSYDRDNFTMIPEIGLTLGVRLTNWLHATAGYNVLYMPSVIRAGDQIDTDVNPGLLAPPLDPLVGSSRPRFQFVESDYWAQGLSLGAQLRF